VVSDAHRRWCRPGWDDAILGVAPLVHITGLVAHIALARVPGARLVLFHRFEAPWRSTSSAHTARSSPRDRSSYSSR
jgi:hypothetical protein